MPAVVGSCAIWPSAGRWTKVPMCQTNPDRRYLADISRDSWTKSNLMIRFGWRFHWVWGKRHIREEAERFTNLIKFVHISFWIFYQYFQYFIYFICLSNSIFADLSINAIGPFLGGYSHWMDGMGSCSLRPLPWQRPRLITPIPEKMIQFDEHMFQMGWFNHQLVK